MRDAYRETRLRVACYMAKSTNRWIREAWRREENKEENAIVSESILTMEEVGVRLRFGDNLIRLDEEVIDEATEYKAVWRKVKNSLQKAIRIEIYKMKEQQSRAKFIESKKKNVIHGWGRIYMVERHHRS